MLAQRRPDNTPVDKLRAGQYVHHPDGWWLRLPDNSQPRRLDDQWTVTEHTDGTITVDPSIRCDWTGWHGFLRRGTWSEA